MFFRLVPLVFLLHAHPLHAQIPPTGLRVPDGFEVTEYADHTFANDIYCMTVDPKGRLVVSGRGYVRILFDDDGNGRADRAIDFAQEPKDGAMGLHWEGDTLYVTGDGGLRRFLDKDGDGKADGSSDLIRAMKTGGEHAAHAIRRGPDGWLYVLCGNNTGIDKSYAALPTSPIKDPIAGCVLRFTPDLKHSEIVAHGFRNAYGMDFNPDGELFTFDSDNERCVSLPWYEPTRFYHVIPGGHYGWLSPQRAQHWRMPPYFIDVVAPLAYLGRGSPTGVACYRHGQFPEEYRGGFFLCDWTFGKVHFASLKRKGASYEAKTRVFLESTGDNGFAPTACVVHPTTGDLFVSIGGRGTRGAVYRVRYSKGLAPGLAKAAKTLVPQGRHLAWDPTLQKAFLARTKSDSAHERLHGLLWLERHQERLPSSQVREAIVANWDHADRAVQQVTVRLIRQSPVSDLFALVSVHPLAPRSQITLALGIHRLDPQAGFFFLQQDESSYSWEDWLDRLRVYQLLMGDIGSEKVMGKVWEGYTARVPPRQEVVAAVRQVLPWDLKLPWDLPKGWNVNREKTRLWALMGESLEWEVPSLVPMLLEECVRRPDPMDNIHCLAVLARLSAGRAQAYTSRLAKVLLALDHKIQEGRLHRDLHWPLRIAELYEGLAEKYPNLHTAVLNHPDFGRPDHALFARAKGFDQKKAAAIFLARIKKDEAYPLSEAIVELLGELPPTDTLPLLRRRWGQTGGNSAMLALLARQPEASDRPRFIEALSTPQPATLQLCLQALDKLPGKDDGTEALSLIRALGNLADKQKELRSALTRRLAKVVGKDLGPDKQAWTTWFAAAHPDKAARLSNPDGVDLKAWEKRLAAVDWNRGDAGRGQAVFVRASCVHCHSSSQALGPDLAGVTGRFSRADLFTAILQPSREVPARYQATLVESADGKVYQGLVIYDAVDGLILQTGAATTVRIPGEKIVARRTSPVSPMPPALLDRLADQEIADLYAYLKSLKP